MIWKDYSKKEDTVLNWCEKKVLPAIAIPRNELVDKKKSREIDNKLTFNSKYYPMFRHLNSQKNYI